MHILKFPWLTHSEENRKYEVFSVSVAPDGERLASGGLDGKVRIWSVDTLKKYEKQVSEQESPNDLVEESDEEVRTNDVALDQNLCRPLCSMGRHTGAVTCVRFSPTGRFLASGSDDKVVLIWEKDEEKTRIMAQNMEQRLQFGTDLETTDLEHWTVRKRLVAHDNDIQDMAWAPDSSILVTVGLDRSIIVWSGVTFEKIKRFDIHQSHVKGVVFDPANKYFATCSDDRTLRIFRYHRSSPTEMSFTVESVIKEPFRKTPLTTYFRRTSWSPDGQNIASPNAINGGLCSVAIIERGNWATDISLIGHDAPCEVCLFSPRLYEVDTGTKQDKEPEISTVLVTAGQDRTLVIWSTSAATPLVVAADVSLNTITDLAWNPTGDVLFLSSLDGSITSVFFDENELGKPIPLDQHDNVLNKYGADRDSMVFPESIDQLKLEEKAEAVLKSRPFTGKLDRLMEKMESMEPMGQLGQLGQTEQKPQAAPQINMLVPRSKKHPEKVMPTVKTKPVAAKPKVNVLTPSSQKVTVTKSGKKRVAPMLISGSEPVQNLPKPVAMPKPPKHRSQFSEPAVKIPRLGLHTLVSSLRDNIISEAPVGDTENENDIDHIAEINNAPKKPVSVRSSSAKRKREIETPQYLAPSMVTPATIFTDMRAQPHVLMEFKGDDLTNGEVMEIRNQGDDDAEEEVDFDDLEEFNSLNKLRVLNSKEKLTTFEFFYNHKFTNMCSSSYTESEGRSIDFWAVSTDTGLIFILSESGRQLVPPFQLGTNLTHLLGHQQYVLAVTSSGLFYSWDIRQRQSILAGVSVSPIINQFSELDPKKRFENTLKVTAVSVNSKGWPIVSLSNENVYLYSPELEAWINIMDPWYFKNAAQAEIDADPFETQTYRILYKRLARNHRPEPIDTEITSHITTTFNSLKQLVSKLP
ncbi:hypothetical protein OGAPHI_004004 [Ogataea philodendri]|uniref:Protein HIR n=1 Tax=Ogataea philodendri TaxID=1378263 RepID=A0A9P8P673_9ASCO|nr:uncharacterized protein OGAPHI_004004 [Ogataea philodendri]KAH3665816.1 hypothetical protein OGAPHI_004004 [Ogataea philodendri]